MRRVDYPSTPLIRSPRQATTKAKAIAQKQIATAETKCNLITKSSSTRNTRSKNQIITNIATAQLKQKQEQQGMQEAGPEMNRKPSPPFANKLYTFGRYPSMTASRRTGKQPKPQRKQQPKPKSSATTQTTAKSPKQQQQQTQNHIKD